MNTAWPAPSRAAIASLVLFVSLLAGASPASGAIVINEVESNAADGGADWVELLNTGGVPVDLGGWTVDDDNDGNGNTATIPALTTIAPSGFHVVVTSGLGAADSARLADDAAAPVASYTWASEAATTYGRCPDGTGALILTSSPTPKSRNNCAGPLVGLTWPGGSSVSLVDDPNAFGPNLSGLTYQPSGTSARGVLWAVRNGPSTLFRLVFDGTKWTPDTADGWGAGKQLFYSGGGGVPDAEGVTLAGGDPNGIYVSTERNDEGVDADISRPAVLRFQVSDAGPTLSATRDWNLTPDLPAHPDNKGLEAVTWVPDDVLVGKGFLDGNTGAAYNPSTYPDHGAGLFFVGVELSGRILAYALNRDADTFTRVAEIESGFPNVMSLEYEPESTELWAVCDDTCQGQSATLDVAQSGVDDGRFVRTGTFERPTGMADLNNEGFAIAPRAECSGGLKPTFYSDDTNTGGRALRMGSLSCTDLPGDDDDETVTPVDDKKATPPPVVTPPVLTPLGPPATLTPRTDAAPGLTVAVRFARRGDYRVRRTGRFGIAITLTEPANLTISATARRNARSRARTILPTTRRAVAAGRRTITLTLTRRIRAALRKGETVTLTVQARDAAGNATTRRATAKVP